jgi:tetratricopeptide (TPR) repeat protein
MIRAVARWLGVALTLLFTSWASAQDAPKRVATSVVILSDLGIAEVAIDKEPVGEWAQPVFKFLETRFKDESTKRVVVVQLTFHPKAPADVWVAGNPRLSDPESKAILKAIDPAKAPHTKAGDFSIQVVTEINGASFQGNATLVPKLQTPDEQKLSAFKTADTARRVQLMRTWARTEALPVLAAVASSADPKYSGVVNLGKSIAGDDTERLLDVAALTDRSPHYWRAMLEMSPDNPLVPTIRAVLHAANGEIDQARRIASIARLIDGKKTVPSRILSEFWKMDEVFLKDLNAKINQGIVLHDKQKFKEAMKIYDSALKAYPNSAWAHYEKFQTLLASAANDQAREKVADDWPKTRAAILAADSLYPSMAIANDIDEQCDLVRRARIKELFKDKTKSKADLLSYAEIALDLDIPGVAGMLYWYAILTTNPNEIERNDLIEHFLYCIDKLGDNTLQKNFKGDHAAAFAKIKEMQAKRTSDLKVKLGAEK